MRNVTTNGGETLTEKAYAESFGDTWTDYVATRDDIISLAYKIADELLTAEFFLELQVGRQEVDKKNYLQNRLSRIMEYVGEFPPCLAGRIDTEIKNALKEGREKNDIDVARILADAFAETSRLELDKK